MALSITHCCYRQLNLPLFSSPTRADGDFASGMCFRQINPCQFDSSELSNCDNYPTTGQAISYVRPV